MKESYIVDVLVYCSVFTVLIISAYLYPDALVVK